ncbi:MAG: glycine oxidase ThiO [Gemmatimonadota bacterium]
MASAVIIGGGVIGLSVAWRCAQRGLTVTLADPAPGTGATRAAAGMLTPVAEAAYAEKDLLTLGSESLRRWPGFAAELAGLTGEGTGFRHDGTLQVAYDADDLAVIEEMHALQEAFGVAAERLTARQCRAAEPLLDPSVRGGLRTSGDGSVDPRRLTRALLAAAAQAGVTLARQAVTEVLVTRGGTAPGGGTAGDRAAGVRLADGTEIPADRVVLAAGWDSPAIGGLPPATVPPVRPVKGQILRLRVPAGSPQLSLCVRGLVRGHPVYLVPRQDGELVVGATQEEMGADTRVTAGGIWELLRDARTLVPGITEFEFTEAVAGLRPGTPDNAPVLGPSGLPGLVLATGHFRGGVLLSPVTAELIADYLVTGQLPALAGPFTAARFGPGSPSPGRPAGDGPVRPASQDGSTAVPGGRP